MQLVTILGATGSIGVNTLDVIERHPERFRVFAITAHKNTTLWLRQIERFQPSVAVLSEPVENITELVTRVQKIAPKTEVLVGSAALEHVASTSEVDIVMAAIVGAAGLKPTLAAAKAGKKVLLANKESLVIAGQMMMEAIRDAGAVLLPIDSEHNAIFQCLPHDFAKSPLDSQGITNIILTGSGGPFRQTPLEQLSHMTPDQACAHPNWVMGRKISVDSATMMNKGFEVIEACHLFNLKSTMIEVVIHPQSIIHSMVRYSDGSVLAQMGQPDMRTPIAYGLSWPERVDSGVEPLDFMKVNSLEFFSPDLNRYPCLKLAFDAFEHGGSMPAILNAANEESVAGFLSGQIRFTQIAEINDGVMQSVSGIPTQSLEALLESDRLAREKARELIKR